MIPSRGHPILGALLLSAFLALSCLVLIISSHEATHTPQLYYLMSALVASFNVVILFSWLNFGIFISGPVTILAFIIGISGALRSGCHSSLLLTLTFFIPAGIGYSYRRINDNLEQSHRLNIEKLDEEINILSNMVHKKKNDIIYLDEKLLSYLVLKDVTEALTMVLTLDQIAPLIIEKVVRTLQKGGRSFLFLVDPEKQELILSASQGTPPVRAKKGDLFDRWVLRHRTPLIIEDVRKDFRFSSEDIDGTRETFGSLIATPLMNEDKVVGVLRMDSVEEATYTHDDLRIATIIADLGAVAIQNSLLYSRIQELAIRDGLTNLFVRRYFMSRFQEEIKRSARKKGALSLLMLDIDHFKAYNDKYGHAAGDLTLKHLARIASASVREGDMVARYGGEEMAILLLGTDKVSARKIAESIRKKIEDEPLVLRREKKSITVSIGVSTYPQDSMLEEELIKLADERLYKAKGLGRNRTCVE